MSRLRALWRIDLIRQSVAAFAAMAVLAGAIVGFAFALDSGASEELAVDLEHSQTVGTNRAAARAGGAERGLLLGRLDAEQQFADLIAAGSEADGYEFGYRSGWNWLIWKGSRAAPLQLRAAAEGTQWIELLK